MENKDNKRKETIIEFIKNTFGTYQYDRMTKFNNTGFEDYEHFIRHNTNCINELNYNDIIFVIKLIKMIGKKLLCNVTKKIL
jgi:hypothetical protein